MHQLSSLSGIFSTHMEIDWLPMDYYSIYNLMCKYDLLIYKSIN